MDQEEAHLQAVLAEYSSLRDEILQRISRQWIIFAFQLTLTGAVFSFSLTSKSRTGFLLIIPIISYAVGAEFLTNEAGIKKLGTYIRLELSAKIPGTLEWESWLLASQTSESRGISLWPLPVISPGLSLIALTWVVPYILFRPNISLIDQLLLGVLWMFGLTITMVSLYDLKRLYWRTISNIWPIRKFLRSNGHVGTN